VVASRKAAREAGTIPPKEEGAGTWNDKAVSALTTTVTRLNERIRELQRERDAYKEAKAENDERFQLETIELCDKFSKSIGRELVQSKIINELHKKNKHLAEAIQSVIEQDQRRGYPTASEWAEIVERLKMFDRSSREE
jgi:hypothetical protein